MLVHIGQGDIATKVHNAWLRTIEDGIHTYDIYAEGVSKQKVGTKQFAEAVIARLGQQPQVLKAVNYTSTPKAITSVSSKQVDEKKELLGVDVYLEWRGGSPNDLGEALKRVNGDGLELQMITNRGAKVWPGGLPETFCIDHWRCRFMPSGGGVIRPSQVISLLHRIDEAGFDFVQTENLYAFNGRPEFSTAPGE